jgi:hypothetical protein
MAKVHRANVTDRDGIKLLLEPARSGFLKRLWHLWLDAGYTGQEDTQQKTKASAGWGRCWDGPQRSCATLRSWLPKR